MSGATRAALALALGSLVLYSANLREISAADTLPTRLLAYELVHVGRLDLDRVLGEWPAERPLPYFVQRVGGHYRSSYPVLPAILAAPVFLGARLAGLGGGLPVVDALSKLAASLMAAVSVAFVYLAARALAARLGTATEGALAAAIVYAAATATWSVSSQGLWGHAPAQLGLAVALWALARHASPTAAEFAAAGLGLGVMVASRPSTALMAAVLAVPGLRAWRRGGLGLLLALGAIVAAETAHNWWAFGSAQGGYAELHRTHDQAHSVAGAWTAVPLGGLPGLLVSPSRGLFVYAPVLLVAVIGLAAGVRAARGGLLAHAAAATAAGVATIAQFSVWWGGHSFGPRLLADVLPALVLGIVPAWAWVVRSRPRQALGVTALVASVLVQGIGAFYYPSVREVEWNTAPADVDHAHARLWDWRDTQLLRLLRNGPHAVRLP